MKKKSFLSMLSLASATAAFTLACSPGASSDNAERAESAQQIGDLMASIDESSGTSSGTLTLRQPSPFKKSWLGSLVSSRGISEAHAASCGLASTFGSCLSGSSGGRITRNFANCSLGTTTFSGIVQMTWGGTSLNCQMQAAGDTVTRVPNFTVTGRYGATLSVTKTGTLGQRLTWTSGTGTSKVFSFTNDGIRRTFETPTGTVLFDFDTETTSALTVTGTARSGRTLSGGTLKINNRLTGVSCNVTPSSVTWGSTCNCASSGSWSGTCSDGKSFSLTLSGCETASLTVGDTTQSVAFDRCYSL